MGSDGETEGREMFLDREWMVLLAGKRRVKAQEGQGLELRLLSALEVLEARREAGELAGEGLERALCSNACLLSRALERDGAAVFSCGRDALEGLSAEQIESLAQQWALFSRRENPSPGDEKAVETLKKAWSTRLTRAFGGVCSARLGRCPRRSGPGR